MEQSKILADIEELIDQLPYKSVTLTVAMEGKTVTIQKEKVEKKKGMGFGQ